MGQTRLAAAGLGFFAVSLGAFGAHALGDALDVRGRELWDTGTLYALAHAAAAAACRRAAPAIAFVLGGFLFAGSLYALALGAPSWIGAVTPVGGVLFLVGWALFAALGPAEPS